MFPRLGMALLLLAVAALFATARPAFAADAGPVTLDDVRQMRRDRSTPKEIAEAIEKRGLGFVVDEAAEKTLRGLGFQPKMIAHLQGMRAAEALVPADAGGAAKAPLVVPGKIQGIPRVVDPQTEAMYKATEDRVRRIVIESATGVKAHPTGHINVLANAKIAELYRPGAMKLQKLLAERFPDPIANGVDPREAQIVLLENRYEYERWIKALFKVHQDDGIKFDGQDPMKSALNTKSIFVRGIYSENIEGLGEENVRRSIAFSTGFLYMGQLSNHQAPAALETGFGNVTETMMFQDPWTVVVSGYTDRRVDGARMRWIDVMKQRFAQRRTGSVANVLAYTLDTMNAEEYAEAWTLTSTLATDPRNFSELITSLSKGTAGPAAVNQVYGVKEEEVFRRWQQSVNGR